MGVIHKLREDVVSFIIEQKKNNPSVGVRQIAALTSEKFQIKVSKSSVNSTLKRASLSSSVGRRAIGAARKDKFSIPESRKKEISKNMEKSGYAREGPLKEKKADSSKEAGKDETIVQETTKASESKKVEPSKEKTLPLMLDLLADERATTAATRGNSNIFLESGAQTKEFDRQIRQIRNIKNNKKSPISKGAGLIFLKAAQWEISNKSLIAQLLKKYFPGSASQGFDLASELFLFLKFLGVGTLNEFPDFKEHGLWKLNTIYGNVPDEKEVLVKLEELFNWEMATETPAAPNLAIEYDLEIKHAFLEVLGFWVYLEDGSEMVFNADLSSFGVGSPKQIFSGEKFPVNKSLTLLSNYLIGNNQSVLFHKVPGEKKFDQTFYDMVAIFENIPEKKILKTAVYSDLDEIMTEFTTIPAFKRSFIVGVTPSQQEFSELTKSAKWAEKKPFYHQGTDKKIYFVETRTDYMSSYFDKKMEANRVITIWKNKEGEPCWAILTNAKDSDNEAIIDAYLSKWPYYDERKEDLISNKPILDTIQKSGDGKLADIFQDFVTLLNKYCQRHFFQQTDPDNDISNFVRTVYDLPGSVFETDNSIEVYLEASSSHLSDKLISAVRRVNERKIYDYYGRRLWLKM